MSGIAVLRALAVTFAATLSSAAPSHAAIGDCSQPISTGSGPVASDCLYVLRSAVGSSECAPCVCDTNASGTTTASDALLCLRAAVGQSVTLACESCCQGPASFTAEDLEALLLTGLDENQDFHVPAVCSGQVPVCCTAGMPVDPCGPVHVDEIETAFVNVQGQSRIDLTIDMRLVSVTAIPVVVPFVGDCLLEIDTNPGPKPTVRIEAELGLVDDDLVIGSVGDVDITDLTADDFALTGSLNCQNVPVSAEQAAAALEEPLAELFALYVGTCLGSDVSAP